MAIEQRPGTEDAQGREPDQEEGRLVGSPSVKAEWSGAESEELPRLVRPSGSPHGKLTSWLVVTTVLVAFTVAGVALVFKAWVLIWICVAVMVLMIPVAKMVRIMDDTVGWARPTPGAITRGDMTKTAMRVREGDFQSIEKQLKDERHLRKEERHARR